MDRRFSTTMDCGGTKAILSNIALPLNYQDPVVPSTWEPSDLLPYDGAIYLRGDSLNGSGDTVAGFIDKTGNGNDLNFSGTLGKLLTPTGINGMPAVRFGGRIGYLTSFQNRVKHIDKNEPFCCFGVASASDWYTARGGPGYYEFWQLNDGPDTCGIIFTTQDPANWPGYTGYFAYVGDGVVPYVGGNGMDGRYNQWFAYLVNYFGGGDFGDLSAWDIQFNAVSDTLIASPPYEDVLPNVVNLVLSSGADSDDSGHAEWFFMPRRNLTGVDYLGYRGYLKRRYNLGSG